MADIFMLKARIRVRLCLCILIFTVFCSCGCSSGRTKATINGYTFTLTTGSGDEAVIRGGDEYITSAQVRVLLEAVRTGYENALTSDIWTMELANRSFKAHVDNMVLDMAARLVLVNMLADDKHIALSDSELADCTARADAFYDEHSEDIAYIKKDELEKLFAMMVLSDKVYDELTRSVDTQVSVDEARVIRIQYIYSDKSGDASSKVEKLEKALEEFQAGEDFAALVSKYSDSPDYTAQIGRGELEKSFEDAAFNLDAGQISDIVSCTNGWYLIYCIDDNVAGKAESQIESIIQRRRNEQFEKHLGDFSDGVELVLDDRQWEKLSSQE